MRLQILVIVCLTLGFGGCAGNAKSTKTQDSLETGSEVQIVEAMDGPTSEGQEEKSEFFDPFDESDHTQTMEYDPLEPVNSAVFEFNYRLDKYVVKPVAKVYNFFIPPDVQQSFSNVFQNIRFARRLFNNLFQGKFQGAGIELSRFLINSTLGVGGLFDPAGIMFELKTPQEDLGQTLGTYGVGPGPFLMIPFFGPFTLRDGIGFIGDNFLDPFNWFVLPYINIDSIPQLTQDRSTIRIGVFGLTVGEAVNARSLTLEKFQGVEEGTLDLYGAVRNAYLQQRLKAIQE
ncbi:MAG: VacJ family lipoprotein [Nitrospirota bacterium]|nr:VacJ family lipoprotein [Nitrospirota bacterium]MDH4360638.1 VacJ family lipoprotein [Nitrospirota bacterium]MDH5576498.1 VacJ family lipoprotein [Nitrospirota bacterium]